MPTILTPTKLTFAAGVRFDFSAADTSVGFNPGPQSQTMEASVAASPVPAGMGFKTITVPAASTFELDLRDFKHVFNDYLRPQPLGATDKVVCVALASQAGDPDLAVGPTASNGFVGPLSGTTPRIKLRAGRPPLVFWEPDGFADDLTANYKLALVNAHVSAAATVLVGVALKNPA